MSMIGVANVHDWSALHLGHHHLAHLAHLAAGHHLHHLARLVELLQQAVHFLQVGAAAFGDALAARAVEDARIGAFLRGHGVDDGLDAFEGVVVDVDILDGLAYAGNHAGQFLQVAHLLDLLDLVQEIVEVELVLLDFALQPLGFFFVILLLGAFHQRYDVAHAQDAVRHA